MRTGSLVAVLPAAGRATRLGRLPCSKEILPLPVVRDGGLTLTTGTELALEAARAAGAEEAAVVVAPRKRDIAAYLGDGQRLGLPLTYIEAANSRSSPETIARAMSWAGKRDVLLLFPDILWAPHDATAALADLRDSGADLALALVPSDRGEKVDIVGLDAAGRVTDVRIKPGPGIGGATWTCARWGADFSAFLGETLASPMAGLEGEPQMGQVVCRAIGAGMDIRGSFSAAGWALDIGTPDDYRRAWLNSQAGEHGNSEA